MRPYNFKVWAIHAVDMQCEWLGERAQTIDVKAAVRGVLRGRKAPAPKAYFRFPQVALCVCSPATRLAPHPPLPPTPVCCDRLLTRVSRRATTTS